MKKFIPSNFLKRSSLLVKENFLIRNYSDKDKDVVEQKKRVTREKGSKPKTESLQEESYFHKEEVEQLKELKKKMKKDKTTEIDETK